MNVFGRQVVTGAVWALIGLSADAEVCDLARFYHGESAYLGSHDAALRAMVPP